MRKHKKGCCHQPNDCVCELENNPDGSKCWCHYD